MKTGMIVLIALGLAVVSFSSRTQRFVQSPDGTECRRPSLYGIHSIGAGRGRMARTGQDDGGRSALPSSGINSTIRRLCILSFPAAMQ